MSERDGRTRSFAAVAGWGDADSTPLAGDASGRRYLRLTRPGGGTAVLMDAEAQTQDDLRGFVRIARHLHGLGLSAPAILAEDLPARLLLLEDLGDAVFTRLSDRDPSEERRLYVAAADALAALQGADPPLGLVRFDPPRMASLVRIVFEWYRPALTGDTTFQGDGFVPLLEDILSDLAPDPTVLALRDCHAENLIWLPDRAGPARVGLLDFQDAVVAHPAYDLVSLLHDARRDVAEETCAVVTRRFLDCTGHGEAAFAATAAVVSAQRNLRILGVFARLALRDRKPGYLRFVPRVWRLLQRDLAHPRLAALKARVEHDLPAPDAAALARLEARCSTPAH